MSDWGLGMALQGLYGQGQKKDNAKEEIATLQSFQAQKEHDNLMDEQAQLKQVAYDNQVSDFADKLLGPDRDRINAKAKVMQARVREEIKTYGGDVSKFLANGGHKFLNDYKSSLVNSPEATSYLENQRNMKSLVDLQLSGKGHLINKNDLYTMKEYNTNQGGNITYTGLLNQIEMPDPNAYDYGAEIPSQDILNKNHAAIYGNFITEYPENPNPTDQDLLSYTRLNYGGKGENYMKRQKEMEEANRHKEAFAKLQLDEQKLMYQQANKKKLVTKTDANGNSVDVWEDDNDYIETGSKEYTHLITNEAMKAVNSRNEKQVKIEDYISEKDYTGNSLVNKNLELIPSTDMFASHLNMSEEGILDSLGTRTKLTKGSLRYDITNKFFNQYSPANAMAVKGFRGNEMDIAQVLTGVTDADSLDIPGKKLLNFAPNRDMYLPDGTQIKHNDDVIDLEAYRGDYTVRNIFIGGIGKNKKGNNEIVMNATNTKGEVDPEKSKKNLKESFGDSDINGNQLMIQLEDDYGQVFYQAVEYTPEISNLLSEKLQKKNQLKEIDTDYTVQERNQNISQSNSKQEEKALADSWNYLGKVDSKVFGNAQQEAVMIGGTYNQDSVNLVKSYYVALALSSGANPNDIPDIIPGIISDSSNNAVSMVADYKAEGLDINSMFKKGMTATQIIDKMYAFDKANDNVSNEDFLLNWRKHIVYLDKFRGEYK